MEPQKGDRIEDQQHTRVGIVLAVYDRRVYYRCEETGEEFDCSTRYCGWIPSEAEIVRLRDEINAGWSEGERDRRMVDRTGEYRPPELTKSDGFNEKRCYIDPGL